MNPSALSAAQLRPSVYAVLIALAIGAMLGRIGAVNSVDTLALEAHLHREGRKDWKRERPFLSANDRSRWVTARALVEHGTYAIDDIVSQRGWDTIDMVKHRGRDGQEHLYSSKPPLLATLMAGEYWLINRLTGSTLADHPYEIGRFMLVTINVGAMLVYFIVLALLAERLGTTDWGRIFMMAAATFGTFLTTFVVTINNHTPAAACVAITLYAAVRIWHDGQRAWRYFAVAGFFAALAVANELPALSLFALLGAALLWKAPRETLWAFLPPALLVAAAAIGTNYLAHDSLLPPYLHRSSADPSDNWYDYTYLRDGKPRESYWRHPAGVDQGEPSPALYALHATIGHHGIFSLTPIWLLSIWGLAILWRSRRQLERVDSPGLGATAGLSSSEKLTRGPPARGTRPPGVDRLLAVFIVTLSLVCLAFYLSRPLGDRNYGGMTSGFRWMFWFAPLWLVALLPAADRLSTNRVGRGIALILLALSVMSASYPTWNPWTHPWLWNFLSYLGYNG